LKVVLELFALLCWIIVPVLFLVVLVLVIVAVKNWDVWKREGSERARRKVFVLLTVIIVIAASLNTLYIAMELRRYGVEYSASVTGGDMSGVMYIPVTLNEELQDELRVVSGDGRMSIVDTEHGRALRLEFSGNVRVEGRVVGREYFDGWRPSMVQEDNVTRGIWVGLELEGANDGSVDLVLDIYSDILNGCDSGYDLNSPIMPGWNTYRYSGWIT
jgi:hypothetical protein